MFIIIPHRSTLALGRRPYVTWGVMAVCLLIHLLAPASQSLMYYPDSWNPLTMVSSSLAHADWLHLSGNLLFFYAFSPMLEEAVANRLRYLLILLMVALVTSVSYSVFSVFADQNIPTLGLSGVVMGVIGLAAYMMPRAKIHTFVWFITHVKNYYIAVWFLAIWFIGWDMLDLYGNGQNSGINLIAHVSGGISGYLIGYFFLARHKKDIKDDVEEAIEYARSEYQDSSSMASTYSGQRGKMIENIRSKDAIRNYENHIAQIYKHVDLGNDAEAIILMLQDSEENQYSVEIYDELFERMVDWPASRTLMSTARFCIDLYMHKRIYLRPLEIVRHCYSVSDEFVLADPMHVLILAKQAASNNDYETAYAIVKNSTERYGKYINQMLCILLEIELLYTHLNQQDKAKALLKVLLLSKHSKEDQNAIMALAKAMQD